MKPTKVSANDWGSTGTGRDSEPDKVIFNVTYVYCAIIEPQLWNIVPGNEKKKKKKKNCAGRKSWVVGGPARHRPP